MAVQSPNARSIFERALELANAAERRALLDEACAARPELRDQVEALLEAYGEVGSFLEKPLLGDGRTGLFNALAEQPGTMIGPYKLLEQIGEGGFGVVFMAEQQQPVRRRVALKVIKPGMDSRQVIARFEAERQALALMDHPNIARVLDAGATESGRPYFVMELVRGIPITDFCDQRRLSVPQRLKLLASVCNAVQHAHQKAVIHRDLKPSNVLVTLHDGEPVAKVIDFGVAKATGQRLTDKTLFTAFAQMVGTPLYMSPEQAEMSGLDVDTRSDIYSLGVMLYELLTGTTPCDKLRLKHAGYDEIRRIIREEDPPRPSSRISTLGLAATTVSTSRNSEPDKLRRLVRGELDWIVMKCLDKDRNRRYDSAGALARDIERYLHDEPVEACPPSALYRAGKFARRNKVALLVGTAFMSLVALILVAITASLWIAMLEEKNYQIQGFRPVQIETDPPGARLAIVPVDKRTGELNTDPAAVIRPQGTTPLTVELRPGDYFVEAVRPGTGNPPDFAEFYTRILEPSRRRLSHSRGFEKWDASVAFSIARTEDVIRSMVAVPISATACEKNPLLPAMLYVDVHENGQTRPPDSPGMAVADESIGIPFSYALDEAHRRGKRLPSAAEYDAITEFVRNHPVSIVGSGQVADMDDLFGGLAEWTTTGYVFPGVEMASHGARPLNGRIVLKGYTPPYELPGPIMSPDGLLLASPELDGPSIGFRGVRSGAPRFLKD